MSREHELALRRLSDFKRKFQERISEVHRQVIEFKTKERISDAESYVQQLEEINKKVEEFNTEVVLSQILAVVRREYCVYMQSIWLNLGLLYYSSCGCHVIPSRFELNALMTQTFNSQQF